MSRQCSKHFSVSIPKVLLQKRESTKKKYFAYEIQIVPVDGGDREKWSLLRRYSEFHRLHEFLQKTNAVIATLDFPPKKRFGNMVSWYIPVDWIGFFCIFFSRSDYFHTHKLMAASK